MYRSLLLDGRWCCEANAALQSSHLLACPVQLSALCLARLSVIKKPGRKPLNDVHSVPFPQIFKNMETLGLTRDAITYSAVISALSKGRQVRQALIFTFAFLDICSCSPLQSPSYEIRTCSLAAGSSSLLNSRCGSAVGTSQATNVNV